MPLGAEVESVSYRLASARRQFRERVIGGVGVDPFGKDVLEIGCGHGGITCFLAVVGARKVIGIDLNEGHLDAARLFQAEVEAGLGASRRLPIEFRAMNASALDLADESVDVVLADNAFEHFDSPLDVMREARRVLRPTGVLVVPVFSSIWSKYGLHLKHGLKLPWANLVFSERTIVKALARLAHDNPVLLDIYPGLRESPVRVRDVRRYKDLNDITYGSFKQLAAAAGLSVREFHPHGTIAGRILIRIPWLRGTPLVDVFSTGAKAILERSPS